MPLIAKNNRLLPHSRSRWIYNHLITIPRRFAETKPTIAFANFTSADGENRIRILPQGRGGFRTVYAHAWEAELREIGIARMRAARAFGCLPRAICKRDKSRAEEWFSLRSAPRDCKTFLNESLIRDAATTTVRTRATMEGKPLCLGSSDINLYRHRVYYRGKERGRQHCSYCVRRCCIVFGITRLL